MINLKVTLFVYLPIKKFPFFMIEIGKRKIKFEIDVVLILTKNFTLALELNSLKLHPLIQKVIEILFLCSSILLKL